MTNRSTQEPIKLPVGATASANTCGSCRFFERRNETWNADWMGYCNVKLPPWVVQKSYDPEVMPPKLLRDDNACDLYRNDGKAYIVSKLEQPYLLVRKD